MKTLGLIGIACLIALFTTVVRAEVMTFACTDPDGTRATAIVDTQKHTITDKEGTDPIIVARYQGSKILTFMLGHTQNRLDVLTGRSWHKQPSDINWVEDSPCVRR